MAKRGRKSGAGLISVKCAICDEDNAEEVFVPPLNNYKQEVAVPVVQCKGCGLMYFNPNLSYFARKSFHTHEFFQASKEGIVGYPNYLEEGHLQAKLSHGELCVRWLRQMNSQVDSCLELGCATGHMLKPMADLGWRCVGLDFSRWATSWGRKNLGLDLRTTRVEEFESDEKFTGVLLWDAFEHFQYPRAVLEMLGRVTDTGAAMVLQTPNVDSFKDDPNHFYWSTYQHCYFYTEETLAKLLAMYDWEIMTSLDGSVPNELMVLAMRL